MLKKGFRLRKKEDFDRVFRFGKPLFFEEIGCRYLKDISSLHFGFSLSKKYLPLAVDRNRFRRVFSEIFYQQKEQWPQGADIIFFLVKKPSRRTEGKDAERIVATLFQTINKNHKI